MYEAWGSDKKIATILVDADLTYEMKRISIGKNDFLMRTFLVDVYEEAFALHYICNNWVAPSESSSEIRKAFRKYQNKTLSSKVVKNHIAEKPAIDAFQMENNPIGGEIHITGEIHWDQAIDEKVFFDIASKAKLYEIFRNIYRKSLNYNNEGI